MDRMTDLPIGMPRRQNDLFDMEADGSDEEGPETFENEQVDQYITDSQHILGFNRDRANQPYNDRLCFFRCLVGNRTGRRFVTQDEVRQEFSRWQVYCQQHNRDLPTLQNFPGVTREDLPALEDCFETSIFAYSLGFSRDNVTEEGDIYEQMAREEINRDLGLYQEEEEDEVGRDEISAEVFFRSMKLYNAKLYLNLNNEHFSLITNISRYARFWRCEGCGRVMWRRDKYIQHKVVCKGGQTSTYAGGGFGKKQTIFEELCDEGIDVPEEDRYHPYRCTYDFECRFEDNGEARPGASLVHEKRLIPVSVSIQSNVPGHEEPVCFVERDPKVLIEKFYERLKLISDVARGILSEKYAYVTEQLGAVTEETENARQRLQNLRNDRAPAAQIQNVQREIAQNSQYDFLKTKWDRWLSQLPVVGFNSSSFDLNLIRRHFIPQILEAGDEILCTITRGSKYLALSTAELLMLDVSNYIGPGTSYSKWLAGFGVTEKKSIWPYSWLTDFDRLTETTTLPPIQAFYSELRNKGVSQEEYAELQATWEREGFRNMKDCLVYYNNCDVGPFLKALDKMCTMFRGMGLDMLKGGNISLPGLAQDHMFQMIPPDVVFQLYNSDNRDILERIQANIVGGPSIIFKRLAVEGVGSVKDSGLPPKKIVGYDANGLYCYCLEKLMPTGIGRRWDPVDGVGEEVAVLVGEETKAESQAKIAANKQKRFHGTFTENGFDELVAVNWAFKRLQTEFPNDQLSLRHKFNGGQKMFRSGRTRMPIDGWVPEKRIIIQYHGCLWHGHDCDMGRQAAPVELEDRRTKTDRIRNLLQQTGCRLVEIWECQFRAEKDQDPDLRDYAQTFEFPKFNRRYTSANQIISEIRTGEFFGFAEVDLQVPHWNTAARQRMSEFPPLFKNTEISIDDIGPTMAEFARQNRLMGTPRRSLIGSLHGTKMLLATPLLKWYMNHDFEVTRLYFAVQYVPQPAFAHLPQEVYQHRRNADANPDQKANGELYKLLGNSYYGKCCTKVSAHRKVEFLRRADASLRVQSPLYRKMDIVSQGTYEVHSAKAKVEYKLPVQIAFMVYSYAKLRMAEFYHDFLAYYIPHQHFELISMDTDSLYLSITTETLAELVPPEKRASFEFRKRLFMVCTDFDRRTGGLFKLEWSGTAICALNPKTYIAFTAETGPAGRLITNVKVSSKGLSKQTNQLTVENFMNVLETREPVRGINRGFVRHEQDLHQYYQWRNGLTFLYTKRIVQPDGINTLPLHI